MFFFYRNIPDDLFERLKEIINAPDNVTIAPSSVVEEVSQYTCRIYCFIFFTEFFFFLLLTALETCSDRGGTKGGSGKFGRDVIQFCRVP